MEGTILGVRSIALSQAYGPPDRDNIRWDCAQHHGASIIRRVLEVGFPKNTLVNINFPNCGPEEVTGTASTVQGQRNQELLRVDERMDGRQKPYFWIAFSRGKITPEEGTDLHALADRRISITPIKLDLTDLPTATEFALAFGG